jgi:uncharacterized repeat protein (TIGR03803 family)
VLSGSTLYGTTSYGGTNGGGTVFVVNTDGTGFTNLYNFTGGTDGAIPRAGLVLSGNTLYGTTSFGSVVWGTVFKINTDGAGFTNLYDFSGGSDGGNPEASLVLSGSTLYGTTKSGGTNGYGTVFVINTDGTSFTNLYSFTGGSDGANPEAGLVLSGNALYGTTCLGGTNSNGTVFKISTDGTGFTKLHDFNGTDGAYPKAGLILSGNILYGTTSADYNNAPNYGTVFAINTDGTGFTNLYSFCNGIDEAFPEAGLVLSNKTLYGTTWGGGIAPGNGTVFAIKTDGTGFTNLYNFTAGSTYGGNPEAGLVLCGNTLYGTLEYGVTTPKNGAVFALSLGSIPLNVQTTGQNQILTWGNPAFSLQTASALTGQWTTLSNAASPYTVSATNPQSFFRLAYTNSP